MKFIKNVPFVYGISVLIMACVLFITYRSLPPEVPLFYSLPLASSQVVDVWYLALLPIISLILILFNLLILKRFALNEPLGISILYVANMFIIVMTTYIFVRIIFLVI